MILKTLPEDNLLVAPETPGEFGALFRLRWEVLRAPLGLPPGSETDGQEYSALHRGVWSKEKQVFLACGRIQALEGGRWQVRYMGVDPACRGRGLGSVLLRGLEEAAREAGCREVVLNARSPARNFYTRCGYTLEAEIPPQLGIPHYRMSRILSP